MNTKILQKILEELQKEKPSIDYMKGMVETLIEMSGGESLPIINTNTQNATKTLIVRTESISDEETEEIPAFLRAGPTGNLNYE